MNKPTSVNILGVEYSITYHDNPADVDIFKRESMWGQIDYWTRSIRIYDNNNSIEDIWELIIHEVLHGITSTLKLSHFNADEAHEDLGVLAIALRDVLIRNNWLKI